MTVYKHEGTDPAESWNELIRRVNALAAECDLTPLDLVDFLHRWSKDDITEVQDKLLEICDENTFNPPPDLWSRSAIAELIAAVENGPCCEQCEETILDQTHFPGLGLFSDDNANGYLVFRTSGVQASYSTYDWAGWVMQTIEPLSITQESCPVELGEDPKFVERREGGRGWVGEQFHSWEVYLHNDYSPSTNPIASGLVQDGYLVIGEGTWRPEQQCEDESPGSGTPLGENDPAWGFRYIAEGVSPPGIWRVYSENDGRSIVLPTSAFRVVGFINPNWVTSPYTIQHVAETVPSPLVSQLRLICP